MNDNLRSPFFDAMDPLHNLISDMAESHASLVRTGMQAERARYQRAIAAIEVAYRAALDDQKVLMPTPLHAAIEQLIRIDKQ
jgi:hypothetical protein